MTDPVTGRTMSGLRTVLGWASDARALSWPVTLVLGAVYGALWLRAALEQGLDSTPLASLVVAESVLAVQWVLLWVGHRLVLNRPWFRWHTATAVALVMTLSILAGALMAMAVRNIGGSGAADVLATETGAMALQRVLALLLVTAIWSGVDDYRTTLARLRHLRVTEEQAVEEAFRRVEGQRREVTDSVQAVFEQALEQARHHMTAAGQILTGLARDDVRRLSHSLAQAMPAYRPKPESRPTPPPWRTVLDQITTQPIIRPVLMSATVTFLFLWQTVSTGPAPRNPSMASTDRIDAAGVELSMQVDISSLLWGLVYLVIVFMATWLSAFIVARVTSERLASASLGSRIAALVAGPLFIVLVVEALVQVAYVVPVQQTALSPTLIERVLPALAIILIALAILIVRSVAETLQLTARNEQARIDELAWMHARAHETLVCERGWMALQLHGPVQSQIISAAIAWEQTGPDGSHAHAWEGIERRLVTSMEALIVGPREGVSFEEYVANLVDTWKPVCRISLLADSTAVEAINGDWITRQTLMDIVTEGVANAIMHGKARKVDVSLELEGSSLLLMNLVDDGTGVSAQERPGLGTRYLDEVCVSWRRLREASGTRLTVALPLRLAS